MLTSLRKSSSVSTFSIACFRLPVKGFAYLFCWPRGRGIGLVCTRRFSFHEFYNFLLFNFLIFIFFGRPFFLPTTFTHTHTHDPRPLPTTHDPRHLATLSLQASNIKWQSEFWISSSSSVSHLCVCVAQFQERNAVHLKLSFLGYT